MKSFARITKLSNISGRADYISNPKRQEHIVAASPQVDWSEYQEFERTHQKTSQRNNEGREAIVMLPNEWAELPTDELHRRGDLIARTVAGDHEYQWAMHWNKDHTNFHIHIVFSERQREKEPGRWDRNIYLTDDGKVARKKSDRAKNEDGTDKPPVHRKGDLKDGFTAKDPKFATRAWCHQVKQDLQRTMEALGVTFEAPAPLHEYHEGKGEDSSRIRQKNEVIRENNRRLEAMEQVGYDIAPHVEQLTAALKDGKTPVLYQDENFDIHITNYSGPAAAVKRAAATERKIALPLPPSFDTLVAIVLDFRKAHQALEEAKEPVAAYGGRDVNHEVIALPGKLREAVSTMRTSLATVKSTRAEIDKLPYPAEPKGVVTKKRRKKHDEAIAEYRVKAQPLREILNRSKAALTEALDFVKQYLRPEERQKQGYGYDAPEITADNIDERDIDNINRVVEFKLGRGQEIGMAAALEARYAKSMEAVVAAQEAQDAVEERYKAALAEIPEIHHPAALEAVKKAIRDTEPSQKPDITLDSQKERPKNRGIER